MAFSPRKKSFKEQTFKEKLGTMKGNAVRAFKKAAAVTLIGGAVIGGPAYYNYGTIQEQEVTVRNIQKDYVGYDSKKYEVIYDNYRIVTDKGTFRNENSMLHAKFNADEVQNTAERGKIYRIKSYGHLPFGMVGSPNIISMQEVTPEEIAERNRAREEQLKQQQAEHGETVATPADNKTPAATTPAKPGQKVLSGATAKVIITAEGYDVELTVPAEVVNDIRVNKVTETQPVRIIQAPKPGG
jgi:phage tail sheath protein FI